MTATYSVYARRAVRQFTEEPVSEATVRGFIDAAMKAPGANTIQSWTSVVIQDRALLTEISDRAKLVTRSHPFPPELHVKLDRPDWDIFHSVGALIVIYARPISAQPNWDGSFAAEHLLIAARNKGVGSCFFGFDWSVLAHPDVLQKLGIAQGYCAVTPIMVGRARDFPPPVKRQSTGTLRWKIAGPYEQLAGRGRANPHRRVFTPVSQGST